MLHISRRYEYIVCWRRGEGGAGGGEQGRGPGTVAERLEVHLREICELSDTDHAWSIC